MKAIVLEKTSQDFSGIVYTENREMPEPKPGEIRIKVAVAGLNPVDYKLAQGWGGFTWDIPPVLGLDAVGTVDALGEGVTEFSLGQRVYAHGDLSKSNGTFAEYACVPAYAAAVVPDSISDIEAAALPCSGFTAYQAVIKKLRVQAGRTILIHGGGGGVGGYGIQLAKMNGVKVFTACFKADMDYVKSLGADFVYDYGEDIYKKIMEDTDGRGVDYVVNTIDSVTATKDIDILAYLGELVAVVEYPDMNRVKFYEKAWSLHEVALGGAHFSGDMLSKMQIGEIAKDFINLVEKRIVKPLPIKTITIKEIPEYLAKLENKQVTGKIVAKIA